MLKIVHEIFHELELFGSAQQNSEDVIYESFAEGDCPDKDLISSWLPMKRMTYGVVALVPIAVLTSWRNCLSMNERLLFFRMFSSKIPIVWDLGVPSTDSMPSSCVRWCNISSYQNVLLRHRCECCPGCVRGVYSQEVVWSEWHSMKVDQWDYNMPILLGKVIYWAHGPWRGP